MPGVNASIFPNRSQYKGPPQSDVERPDVDFKVVGAVTHAIDGCSTPQDKFYLFPPNLFVNPKNPSRSDFSLNPLSKPFYEACAAHDVCYQTCRNTQNQCDANLHSTLMAHCNALSTTKAGSGFFDMLGH